MTTDTHIVLNDAVVLSSGARIAPTCAGLLYGWGVFTTMRIYEGRAFAFNRHWQRMIDHAKKARIPHALTEDRTRELLDELMATNGIRNGRARMTLVKGSSRWSGEECDESTLLMFSSRENKRVNEDEIVTLSPYRIISNGPLAGVKITGLLEHFMAIEEVRSRGFTDAVMLNERGEVVGTTSANIFWIKSNSIYTPSLETGAIDGITRRFVTEICRKMRLPVEEGGYPVQRLLEADEVFVTSTAKDLAPVAEFDFRSFNTAGFKIMGHIQREFQKIIRDARISQ